MFKKISYTLIGVWLILELFISICDLFNENSRLLHVTMYYVSLMRYHIVLSLFYYHKPVCESRILARATHSVKCWHS